MQAVTPMLTADHSTIVTVVFVVVVVIVDVVVVVVDGTTNQSASLSVAVTVARAQAMKALWHLLQRWLGRHPMGLYRDWQLQPLHFLPTVDFMATTACSHHHANELTKNTLLPK